MVKTQDRDGQFEYYYDAKTDSQVNHEHPTRDPVTNPFYNMVRHCGGILSRRCYEVATRDERLVESVLRDAGSLANRVVRGNVLKRTAISRSRSRRATDVAAGQDHKAGRLPRLLPGDQPLRFNAEPRLAGDFDSFDCNSIEDSCTPKPTVGGDAEMRR